MTADRKAAEMPAVVIRKLEEGGRRLVTGPPQHRIVWRVWGEGTRPVLLLHGNFGSWLHWARNIEALASRTLVLVPDMPGFNESDPPPGPVTLDSVAASLLDGMRDLGVAAAGMSVVGFSFGTNIAGGIARQAGGDLARLVLVSPGSLGLPRIPVRFTSWRRLGSPAEQDEAHRANLAAQMFADPSRIDDLAVTIQRVSTSNRRLAAEEISSSNPLRDILPALRVPITAMFGDGDRTIGPHLQTRYDYFAGLGAGSDVIRVEDAGHWVQYENAAVFNRELLRIGAQPA